MDYAGVGPGTSVAVLGLGLIGQMSARIARHRGAELVVGVDRVPERLAMAARHGIEVVDLDATDDPGAELRERTDGRGPDAVIDAVGMEAHGAPVAHLAQRLAALLPDPIEERLMERAD